MSHFLVKGFAGVQINFGKTWPHYVMAVMRLQSFFASAVAALYRGSGRIDFEFTIYVGIDVAGAPDDSRACDRQIDL